jgi:hypothetical protein
MRSLIILTSLSIVFGCSDSPENETPFIESFAPTSMDQMMPGPQPEFDSGVTQPADATSPQPDGSMTPIADMGTTMNMDLPPDPMVNTGWIGGPCDRDTDCNFDEGYCLPEQDGFPRGMCTQGCSGLCPDRDGMPVTFCAADVIESGTCVQRCDSTFFAATGCRPGYTCEGRDRAGEPQNNIGVCVPGSEPIEMMPPTDVNQACLNTLTELGVQYTVASSPDDSPSNRPDLTCRLNTPLYVQSPIGNVDYLVHSRSESSSVFVTCYFARALLRLSELLEELDVVRVGHIGTYNCRVISGTDTLSEHGNANAIDLKWFETRDGHRYDVEDHWEHGRTSGFATEEGEWLYQVSRQMFNRRIFNIILTPEFNAAHDNHFHVDMTPGARFIESNGGGYYIGPNVHGD